MPNQYPDLKQVRESLATIGYVNDYVENEASGGGEVSKTYVDQQDGALDLRISTIENSGEPVITDGVTVIGMGTLNNPLTSPRQGLVTRGPYDTVDDIPLPYDPLAIYLTGTASPYAEHFVIEGELVNTGTTEVDFANYYPKIDVDTLIANIATVQQPFIKAYKDNGNSNVFTLPKLPIAVTDIWVLDGGTSMSYLRVGNYSISGQDVTITSPAMTDTSVVKIIYTSKGGA